MRIPDHRRVKGRLQPMLGFKTFYNARRVIIGIELAQKIHKRQFAIPIPWQSNPAVIWRHVMLDGGITYKPLTRGPFTRSGWVLFTLSKRGNAGSCGIIRQNRSHAPRVSMSWRP